jgi:hypothetical protein
MLNPWLALTFQAARLTWEAQGAMALRLMKLAGGGANGMSAEKVRAPAEAQPVATTSMQKCRNGAPTGKKVSNTSKKKVRAKERRPSGLSSVKN